MIWIVDNPSIRDVFTHFAGTVVFPPAPSSTWVVYQFLLA
jgi:hypothetical protein